MSGILTVVDIDDTLFRTPTKIHVNFNGERIKSLTKKQFAKYSLNENETFDFSDFHDSEHFNKTAKPIKNVIKKIQKLSHHAKKNKDSKIIICTARPSFKQPELFIKTFYDHGLNIDNIYIERAGDIEIAQKVTGAEAKMIIIRRYIDAGNFHQARIFEDSLENIVHFHRLKFEYPKIRFKSYWIDPKGNIN